MQFYSAKIDYNYFGIKKDDLMGFCRACEDNLKTKDIEKLYNYNIEFSRLKESKFWEF